MQFKCNRRYTEHWISSEDEASARTGAAGKFLELFRRRRLLPMIRFFRKKRCGSDQNIRCMNAAVMGMAMKVRSKKQITRSLSLRGSLEASMTTMVSEKKMI